MLLAFTSFFFWAFSSVVIVLGIVEVEVPSAFAVVREDDDEEPIGDTQEQTQDDSHAEISFHAISGPITPQTLRFPGKIKNKEVVV
ncbi:hypothetical protein Tco_0161727 [Tanacetum coccineum]